VAVLEPAAPLLAKRNNKIYLIGSLGFVLCPSTRFLTQFGSYRTQHGPPFWPPAGHPAWRSVLVIGFASNSHESDPSLDPRFCEL